MPLTVFTVGHSNRSLVSDALVCRGAEKTAAHRLTPFVKFEDGRPTYPEAQVGLLAGRS